MSTVNLPDVPDGLELKRDLAIANLAISHSCSLQEAADKLRKVMDTVNAEVAKVVGQ